MSKDWLATRLSHRERLMYRIAMRNAKDPEKVDELFMGTFAMPNNDWVPPTELIWKDSLMELPIVEWTEKVWSNQTVLAKVEARGDFYLVICEFDRTDADKWLWHAWVPCEEGYEDWHFIEIPPPREWCYLPESFFEVKKRK